MANTTLKVKVNDPYFQYQPRVSQDAFLVILAQICQDLLSEQIKFPKILSLNSQNDLEGQGQWPSFSIPDKIIPICMFGANLMIPSQICDELLCGRAEFPRILSQNDLQGQGQWPLFSIPAESIPGCIFVANLMILAQICDELSCGQSKVHGLTDGQMQATTIPLRPARPRGKNELHCVIGIIFIFISITISCIFNWKQIQLESLKYQLSPWLIICTPFNGLSHHIFQMAINYI